MTELITILQILLLMNDNVSEVDLMLKYKFSAKDIFKSKEVLEFINRE
ncbi:MAG: hypothetical protein WC758_07460 [Candidatus Woesearchaeota archaeon]|jgi:hypothetical protein